MTLPASINAEKEPFLKEKIKNGSLFLWQCPQCGTTNLLIFKLLYHDPENRLLVLLLPSGSYGTEKSLEKINASIALQKAEKDSPDAGSEAHFDESYTMRLVRESGSLIEKINIADNFLDDRVVELCKFVTKMELLDNQEDKLDAKALSDAVLRFHHLEGADGDLIFTFALGGQMQSLTVGFNVYEDCRGILRRNPSMSLAPGFHEINSSWVETRFR